MFKCVACNHTFESEDVSPSCPQCGGDKVLYVAATEDNSQQYAEHVHEAPGRTGCPWENRGNVGWVGGMLQTIRGCLMEPSEMFSRMETRGDMASPLLFVVILGSVGGLFSIVWQNLFQSILGTSPQPAMPAIVQHLSIVAGLIIVPVIIVMSMFISAGILHLCLLMLGAADEGFEATFRTVCYASGSTALLAVVPFCGSIVGGIWNMVITIIGLHKMHEAPLGRVVVAYFLPLIVCCGLVVAGMVAMMPFLAQFLSELNP